MAVSRDPELLSQLTSKNQQRVKLGLAPYAPQRDQVGGKKKFDIHHVELISNGGAVYDMENLRVVTPKQHIEAHRPIKEEN